MENVYFRAFPITDDPYSRETLNHLSVSKRMADTALDMISLCRVVSTSSSVGGGKGGAGKSGKKRKRDNDDGEGSEDNFDEDEAVRDSDNGEDHEESEKPTGGRQQGKSRRLETMGKKKVGKEFYKKSKEKHSKKGGVQWSR